MARPRSPRAEVAEAEPGSGTVGAPSEPSSSLNVKLYILKCGKGHVVCSSSLPLSHRVRPARRDGQGVLSYPVLSPQRLRDLDSVYFHSASSRITLPVFLAPPLLPSLALLVLPRRGSRRHRGPGSFPWVLQPLESLEEPTPGLGWGSSSLGAVASHILG